MENILVTGGLGFIGSWYVKLLIKEGYYPIIIDKNTYAADMNRIKDYNIRLKIGDIYNKELIEDIIKKHNISTIVNFAAETHVDRSIQNSDEFINSNFVGVQNLLEIVRHNNIDRLVQVSTDEVYGSIEEGSFKETDRLNPGNPYSACKAGADLLALSYHNTYGIDVCITRSSNNYGPFQHREKFIPRMISLALHRKALEIYGRGNNVRDWLWVEDNCNAILIAMKDGISGEIYNISAGNEKNNNEIAKIISDKFDVGIEYIEDRKGHDYRYGISSRKIWEKLNWKPKKNFYDGLEETINFYKNGDSL